MSPMLPNDPLDKLEKRLDKGENVELRRTQGRERASVVPRAWGLPPAAGPARPRLKLRAPELAFAVSVVFFIIAAGVAALMFFSGDNTVSTRNVDVVISGPAEIGAGKTLQLQVVITNRNSVPMDLTDLVVEFPPGTRSDTNISVELPRIRESLGTIAPGESVARTIRSVVFGEEGTHIAVTASVEYRIESSNAIFVSKGDYVATVNEAPATIAIDALTETVSGQEVGITVSITSNSPEVLTDILLKADYPPGFSFSSSAPQPFSGSNVWSLGDMEPSGTRTVTIRGTFAGEDGDTRVIHFSIGSRKANQAADIAAPLSSADLSVTVTKPFISLSLALDGRVASEHVIPRGKEVRGDVSWVNNLPVRAQDVTIELSLKGAILDRTLVDADHGFFRSSDNTLIWSRETDSALADVAPGASGVASFSFSTLPLGKGTFRNPELALSVVVKARRLSEVNVPETISSSAGARAVVATDLSLTPSLSHGGALQDFGPVPPRADTETSYTVTWTVSNSQNAVANASVTAVLPSYVRFTGVKSPGDAAITYNPVGGIVTWTVGDLSENSSKTASFQVALTPSLTHVGTTPTVVGDERLYGFDRFARTQIERTAPSLTTASASAINGVVTK